MIETLGSIGAQDHAGPDGHAVGIELSVSHLRSVTSGYVHGVATPLHLGRSQTTYLVELRDDDGNLIASGRITCRIITTDWRGQ